MVKKVVTKKVVTKKVINKPAVKKAAVKKLVTRPSSKKPFTMLVDIDNDILKSNGISIIECLEGIKPIYFKTKVDITVKYKKLKGHVILYPFQFKRLLIVPLMQEVFQKRILTTLK